MRISVRPRGNGNNNQQKRRFMDRPVRSGFSHARELCLACKTSASSDDPTWRSPHHSQREKRTPARALASVVAFSAKLCCHVSSEVNREIHHTHPPSPSRNQDRVCFRGILFCLKKQAFYRALANRLASIHPEPNTVSREPCSLLQATSLSFVFLLLAPRSAPTHVPARSTPSLRHLILTDNASRLPTHECFLSQKDIASAAWHKHLAKRHPFSRLFHSASQLLRTAWTIPASMATSSLSP
jgi:hypothetical protein